MADNVSQLMTDAEIEQVCEKLWVKDHCGGWGLTFHQLIRISYVHGDGGGGLINGLDDKPGDVVYISPSGSKMTRHMCSNWIDRWYGFHHGFNVAWRYLEQTQSKQS